MRPGQGEAKGEEMSGKKISDGMNVHVEYKLASKNGNCFGYPICCQECKCNMAIALRRELQSCVAKLNAMQAKKGKKK